jgi:hypothetical protein
VFVVEPKEKAELSDEEEEEEEEKDETLLPEPSGVVIVGVEDNGVVDLTEAEEAEEE